MRIQTSGLESPVPPRGSGITFLLQAPSSAGIAGRDLKFKNYWSFLD